MKRLLILVALVFTTVQIVSAQKEKETSKIDSSIQNEMTEAKAEMRSPINAMLSAADVGEPDSFGKNAKFLGTAKTGAVYVYYSCDPQVLLNDFQTVLGADDRCLVHDPLGTVSTATFDDLGRITVPGKSVDNVIYFFVNNTIQQSFENPHSNGMQVFFRYTPRITIESSALNDPALINPQTGLPYNGVLSVSTAGTKLFNRTVPANTGEQYFDYYTSAATRGLARGYFQDIGLPNSVINQLFKQPMTIKLGMRISVLGVSNGTYYFSMRFLGN